MSAAGCSLLSTAKAMNSAGAGVANADSAARGSVLTLRSHTRKNGSNVQQPVETPLIVPPMRERIAESLQEMADLCESSGRVVGDVLEKLRVAAEEHARSDPAEAARREADRFQREALLCGEQTSALDAARSRFEASRKEREEASQRVVERRQAVARAQEELKKAEHDEKSAQSKVNETLNEVVKCAQAESGENRKRELARVWMETADKLSSQMQDFEGALREVLRAVRPDRTAETASGPDLRVEIQAALEYVAQIQDCKRQLAQVARNVAAKQRID